MDILTKIDKLLEEKASPEQAKEEIINFLSKNPKPSDSQIHKLSDDLGIDTHIFESYIYEILGSFLGAGRAKEKGVTEKDVDPKELKMGIKVEMEHTTDPVLAKRIALDHLAELDDYYTRLDKMESEAGVKH
jgi:hypothetical protein